MPRVHRAARLALAAPLIGSLAIAAGCGSSSDSSASSAAAPAPSSASTAAAVEAEASSTSTEAATTETAPASTAAPTTSSAGSSTAAASGSAVEVSADPNGALEFVPTELKAKAGEVTIDFTNTSSVPHSVAIEQGSATLGSTEVISQSTAKMTVKLKPGTYTFFCTVPGHAEAGMKGTLTVQ